MKTIGNILWFVFVGLWSALGWLFCAVVLFVLIVTIPFGRQCLKLAHFSAWPFGREAVSSPNARALGGLGQVLWVLFAGMWIAFGYVIGGALLCITIIGIPFGLQSFKLAGLAIAPFGTEIIRTSELRGALASR